MRVFSTRTSEVSQSLSCSRGIANKPFLTPHRNKEMDIDFGKLHRGKKSHFGIIIPLQVICVIERTLKYPLYSEEALS